VSRRERERERQRGRESRDNTARFPRRPPSPSPPAEDGELHITLTKASRGEPWPAAFAAHAPADVPEPPDAGRLLLERFAEDHPGFDFSSASLTGAAPDPRTFLREEEEPE
jgi:hypothetical protein